MPHLAGNTRNYISASRSPTNEDQSPAFCLFSENFAAEQ